jgi:hypothetical protein
MPLPTGKHRHLNLAGRTPCSPEIEQHNLALQPGETHAPAGEIAPHKLRSRVIQQRLRAAGLPIRANRCGEKQSGDPAP